MAAAITRVATQPRKNLASSSQLKARLEVAPSGRRPLTASTTPMPVTAPTCGGFKQLGEQVGKAAGLVWEARRLAQAAGKQFRSALTCCGGSQAVSTVQTLQKQPPCARQWLHMQKYAERTMQWVVDRGRP